MNLEIESSRGIAAAPERHLSADEMAELLAEASSLAPAHLFHCEPCANELDSLRESLSLFRQATHAYVAHELRTLPQVDAKARARFRPWVALSLSGSRSPALFATAAALLLAAAIPLEMQRQRAIAPPPPVASSAAVHTAESDDALLEGIDRELALSVPAPMQALADPSGDSFTTSNQTFSSQTLDQRKD